MNNMEVMEDTELQSGAGEWTVLVLDFRKGRLGGCFYTSEDQSLLLIEDYSTGEPLLPVEQVITQLRPTKLLVNSSLDRPIMDKLEQLSEPMVFTINLKPSGEFKNNNLIQSGWIKKQMPANMEDATVMIGTLLALTKFIETNLVLENSHLSIDELFSSIDSFFLQDYMYIDQDSLLALQIVPDALDTNRSKKSHTSILQLLDFAGSSLGEKRLRSWLLRPLSNLELIKERQETISLFFQPKNAALVEYLTKCAKLIPNIYSVIIQLKAGKATASTWLKLNQFFIVLSDIHCHLQQLQCGDIEYKLLKEFNETLDIAKVVELKELLSETLDIDLTKELQKPTVLDGVDDSLDQYRKGYNQMEQILQKIAAELGTDLPKELSTCLNVAYIPQLGYLILMEGENLNKLQNFALNSNWNEIFRTSITVYYKNNDMEEMDSYYGDTYSLMCDCEIEILQDLSNFILQHEKMLLDSFSCFATIDCFLALTKAAIHYNYIKPELVDDQTLEIENSRHPIYEFLVPSFVPNDINLSDDERILLITGANLSGKSVILTQIGLIVYLAHIGSFVPASKAKIGLCDRILTRILSRETISKQKSTFLTDVQQMDKCLRWPTPRSLILVDEFGKGTDLNDGPALLGSTMKYLSNLSQCPRSIMATHFHDLFSDLDILGFLNLQKVKYQHMEIITTQRNDPNLGKKSNEIVYLFQLRDGLANNSFGIYCAKICGVDQEIIERAELFVNLIQQGENLLKFCNNLNATESRDLLLLEDAVKEFIMWDLDDPNLTQQLARTKLDHILSICQAP